MGYPTMSVWILSTRGTRSAMAAVIPPPTAPLARTANGRFRPGALDLLGAEPASTGGGTAVLIMRPARHPSPRKGPPACSKSEPRGLGVTVEHAHRVERVVGQITSEEGKLLQEVGCDCDHVAADGVCLDDVEELARAGPEQLLVRVGRHGLQRLAHQGDRVAAGVGDATGEDGDYGRWATSQAGGDRSHLIQGQDGRDVEADPVAGQLLDKRSRRNSLRVGHWNLDVNVLTP